jgi:hypothetical protein
MSYSSVASRTYQSTHRPVTDLRFPTQASSTWASMIDVSTPYEGVVNTIYPASSSQHMMFGKCHCWTCVNFWRALHIAFLHNTVSTLILRL